jgi:ATP-dependent RNA helicase SUPV3L1/SUV3
VNASESSSAKATLSELDQRTGGAFTAPTSGERAARLRDWLATDPSIEALSEVYRELAGRDKGAAKLVRERLDELRRARAQDAIAAEWAARAEALLAAPRLNLADAMAWQRDAAKAGAPLSREPLAGLRQRLSERMKAVEDLQTRIQVEREAAGLLVQRIDLLSTKPVADAQAARDALAQDVQDWQQRAAALVESPGWADLDPRYPAQLDGARQQLEAVWQAFDAALAQAVAALADAQAPLPGVPVWADEIRAARGEPSPVREEAATPVPKAVQALAQSVLLPAIEALERELAEGHTKAMGRYAGELRHAVKVHGRHAGPELEARAHAALAKANELEDWQRWRADQLREGLLAQALALTQGPEAERPTGRKLQETIRQLREQWKQIDQGGTSNHALWKRFDEACNQAYQAVEAWRRELKAQNEAARQARLALIEEVKAWTAAHADSDDWRAQLRDLHAFAERWRQGGHVSEKTFAELQPLWKAAMAAAHERIEAAQADSVARRQALIAEAQALAAEPRLRLDAVKALQQRWQEEAHRVPLDRRQEQKLWEAFRQPIDAAFARKSAEREKAQAVTSRLDAAVLDAVRALEAACASDDAQQIRAAMAALRAAAQGEGMADEDPVSAAAAPAESAPDASAATPEAAGAGPRPVVARRGDDRPGAAPVAAHGGPADKGASARAQRPPRPVRGHAAPRPRLGDAAFRAQRQALEQAEAKLRQLAARAQGEALSALLAAWAARDPARVPAAAQLGGRQAAAARGAWVQALQRPPADAAQAAQALLRLEIAAEVPTPAEHLDARRQLQLQLLTRRHEPGPAETWAQDVAQVLASAHDPAAERRLQAALRVLLRR